MLLKFFNLAEQIKQYNLANGSKISEDSDFGFTFFQKNTLNDINKKISLINEGHDLCVFNDEEMSFIKLERKNLREKIKQFSTQLNPTNLKPSSIYHNLHLTQSQIELLRKQIKSKLMWQEWLNKEMATLNNKILNESKEYNIQSLQTHKNIEELYTNWPKHNSLALFNDTAIYRITSEILPSLYHYLQNARIALRTNQHHIPIEISTQYIKYLKEFEQDLQKLEITIVESMLARLQAYDQSRGTYSSPILHMAKKNNPAFIESKQPYKISPEEFNFFHQYIEKHGNTSAKSKLHQRSWYTSNNNNMLATTVVKSQVNGFIIVPKSFAHLVPIKKRWPSFLFGDINLRQDLFLENTYLLANLKMFANRPSYFLDLHDVKSLREPLDEINKNESLINGSILKLKSQPYSNVWWFSFGTKALFENWHKVLLEQKFKLCEAKLNLAERVVSCLKSQLINPISVPWESYELLLCLSQELEAIIKDQSINQSLQDRMYAINTTLTRFAPIKKFIEILEKLANKIQPSAEQLDYLMAFMDRHIENEADFIANLTSFCKLTLEKIVDNLIQQLKIDPFSNLSIDELAKQERLIISYYAFIERLKDNDINQSLEKRLKFFFLRFLEHFNDNDISKSTREFVIYKNILSIMGKNVNYLDKPISHHIKDLETQKCENLLLFKINCKSLSLTLASHFLEKRFNKHITQLDNEFINKLKQKNLSIEIISSLLKQRDRLTSLNSFEDLKLNPSEQALLGIHLPENSQDNLIALFQLSAKAHSVKNKLSSNISYEQKAHLIKNLNFTISEYFSHADNQQEVCKRNCL
jgi:hypothetical protein